MFENEQVGWAYPNGSGVFQAAMWHGSKESYINLAPPLTGFSRVNATCGSAQVGYVNNSAAVWFGTRESYQNLRQYLPAGYGESECTSVSVVDGTYYIGGYARESVTGTSQAFVWIGVPTPGTLAAFSAAAVISARRVRR